MKNKRMAKKKRLEKFVKELSISEKFKTPRIIYQDSASRAVLTWDSIVIDRKVTDSMDQESWNPEMHYPINNKNETAPAIMIILHLLEKNDLLMKCYNEKEKK